MKTLPIKSIFPIYDLIISALVGVIIFCIPLFFVRIHFWSLSASIVTIFCILLCILLLVHYYRIIIDHFFNHSIWVYGLALIFSFIPSLIFHPTFHATGVYIEWIIAPFFTALCISAYIHHNTYFAKTLIIYFFSAYIVTLIIALSYVLSDTYTYDGRLRAFYDSPNQLALYLTPFLILFSGYLYAKRSSYRTPLVCLFILISLFIIGMTQSFNAFFALVVSACTTYIIFMRRRYHIALMIPLCIIIMLFVGFLKYSNSENIWSHNSLGSRVAIWQSATFHIQKSPLRGHEIDAFQEHYLMSQKYFTPFPEWAVPTPHNILLTLLFSGGFFSALFFLLITTRTLTHIYVLYKETGSFLLLVHFAALSSILLLGIFDTPFWKIDQAYVFWTLIASSVFLTHHINFFAQSSTQETV